MAQPALATLSDLEARGVDVSDRARALAAIEDASALVHHESRDAWIDGGELSASTPDIARTVAIKVARRVLSGADDGIESEGIGDYSVRYRNGDAYLTRAEAGMIRSAARVGVGLGAVRLSAPFVSVSHFDDDDEVDDFSDDFGS
jgi:hypothetical protein